MTGQLAPGTKVAADAVAVQLAPVAPDVAAPDGAAPDVAAPDNPLAGFVTLAGWRGGEVGIWEHSPGVSEDVEVDEVFVVISGAATIEFLDPTLPALRIGPGDIVRLPRGAHTRWTITERLRKVYVTMESDSSRHGAAQEGTPA